MGQIQSYYRILGLEADASTDEIREAIQSMRDLDTEGNYTAILGKIEKTLLPLSSRPRETSAPEPPSPAPAARPAPNRRGNRDRGLAAEDDWSDSSFDAHEKEPPGFLDIDDGGHDSAWNIDRTPVKDHRRFITEEEIRAYNRPPSLISKIINFRNILLILLAVGVGIAGFIFGMPLYQQYMANKQGNEAMPVLISAKDEVEKRMRQKTGSSGALMTFPDTLSGNYDSPLYTVRVNSSDETITLTFSQEAAEPLRGHSLIMRTTHLANIGLQWVCGVSGGFPATHKPAQCY